MKRSVTKRSVTKRRRSASKRLSAQKRRRSASKRSSSSKPKRVAKRRRSASKHRRSVSKRRGQKGGAVSDEIRDVYKYITREIERVKQSFAPRIAELEKARFKLGSDIELLDKQIKKLQLK